jgi:hypothetical protein
MFTDDDRARAKNIETMLGKLQNSDIPAAIGAVQTRADQTYDRLGRNPADTASAVWKYGVPGYNGTKEARQRLAGIDAGKASTNLRAIVAAVVAAVTGKQPDPEPTPSSTPTTDTKAGA